MVHKPDCYLEISESLLADQAMKLVSRDPSLRACSTSLEFEHQDDVLVVRGRVPTFYLKQLLQTLLKRLNGTPRIDNRVEVVLW
jgi:hypothetical protein